ncbi:transcriptional regulator, LuxR family [Amycolatopsis marina]|uniref:Transcriptional regulator, LuxR family n=1 Tax=Amycolatopsis marina TaxID=490629 RepID=A0A1I0YHU5_9PSEU|nr:LuxR family transcriptional regulator [Amycolatopsis marina]SFB12316.1 transcriptional regulator, LuxR family [Amycolatopsis marina]
MHAADALERGRESYSLRAWRDAFDALSAADKHTSLAAADLDRLGMAAYLIGLDEEAVDGLQRAHHAFLVEDEVGRAIRSAFWLGLMLFLRGRRAEGGGWLGRAQHLLERDSRLRVERAYLMIPTALQTMENGDPGAAYEMFGEITRIANHSGDPDLVALSRLGRGQSLISMGEVRRGVAMLDEAMVAVTIEAVSPIAAGIVYCALVVTCRQIFDLRRAQEWTVALGRWCATQQDLKPYRGQCLVHRSEIMQVRGEWAEAMDEVRQACAHLAEPPGNPVLGMAHYQRAELLRLRGQFAQAEQAYRKAGESGHPVQPGLALLRLGQGRIDDAEAAIRRVVDEAEDDRVKRSRVLAAFVEIVLATGDVEGARAVADELTEFGADFDTPYLRAVAASARGAVLLADGDAHGACVVLRAAWTIWHEIDAPYEAARVQMLMAETCERLADHDTASMELDAARRTFEQLGAAPALARVAELSRPTPKPSDPGGLTPRELDVLRLVATGATSREVAERLHISEKTVARHLSNIFAKLGVTSRSAATAYAYRHELA